MRPSSACPDPAPGLEKLSNPSKGLFWGDPRVPRPACTIVDGACGQARGMGWMCCVKSVGRKHKCLSIIVFVWIVDSMVLWFLGCRIA